MAQSIVRFPRASVSAAPRPRSALARPLLWLGLPVGLAILGVCLILSITFGAATIRPENVWAALVDFNGSTDHLIIRTLRVPRALTAALVGAALAVAGAIMQGLTRNPLASPSILGINAGAAFAVVLGIYFSKVTALSGYVWYAFAGATLAALTVYVLGSAGHGGMTPLKLTIAGASLTALLSSLTTAMLILNQRALDEIRFWLAGSVAGRDLTLFLQALPYAAVGLFVALIMGRQITLLTLGEDIAKGMGMNTTLVKAVCGLCVVLLAGSAVALAGPIALVGLIIPHMVRFFTGADYRWTLPYAALGGAVLLVCADLVGRLILRPIELPVGVLTAMLGAPMFIYLARRKVKR